MNFYELKSKLNLPTFAGPLRRKEDLEALLQLSIERADVLEQCIEVMSLNRIDRLAFFFDVLIALANEMAQLHRSDIFLIKKYLKESKIPE